MTDVPADNGAPGPASTAPSEPPVVRRSNYASPPPGVEPPYFDDDALADAMAAEVRPYTSPITLPKLPGMPPPAGAEFDAPPPVAPPPAPIAPVSGDGTTPASDPPVAGNSVAAPAESPTEDELLRSLGGASTIEAIERLENELRLISSGEASTLDLTSAPDAEVTTPPISPAPVVPVTATDAPGASPAASDPPVDATPATAPDGQGDVEPEPALDHPAVEQFFPAAPEPIAPDAAPAPTDATIGSDALAWPVPPPVIDASRVSEAVDAPRGIPGLQEVDVSLIDPAAAAELNSPPPLASPWVEWPAARKPSDEPSAAGYSMGAASDSPTEAPWWDATAPVDGAWDLAATPGAPGSAPDAPLAPAPEAQAPAPQWPVESQGVEPQAVEPQIVELRVVEPQAVEPPDIEAPGPDVLSPDDSGPIFATPVPISTEPPVGPESPDWLDAPPPAYSPPELVEPPTFIDTTPDATLNPVSPITANTMVRLPMPLPTEQPKLEDRAELPPPPGYEDIPIMSSDAALAASRVALTPYFTAGPPLVAIPSAPEAPEDPEAPDGPEATESAALDHDEDDVIDEVDRVTGIGAIPISSVGVIQPLAPPSEPIATPRLSESDPALVDENVQPPSAFEVETAGPEPTALDLRAGRAARLFWLWFAANSSVLSLGLGAVLLGTGMSLRQAIVATLAGVAISFLPLGLGTLAGKWSGQPTMIVSRATFGHAGNILPALLAVATRVLWGGVLLWLLATAIAQVLVGAGLDAGLGATIWQLVGLVTGFVIATVIAVFGYGFVAKLQLVLSILSALLIVGAAVLTYRHLDFVAALRVPDGSWTLVISGAALVFSVVGLAWVHSSSDLARYQRPASSGGSSMLWATFGATLPPFALIAWGAMLAASDPALAKGLTSNPLAAIASLLPSWYPAPLLAAAALGLLSGAVITMYSGGFALQALGVRVRRSFGTFIAAILVLVTAAALLFVVSDFSSLLRDLVITVAVPVAAWAGIFAAEMMIRSRRFHTPSLLAPGGLYPQVRWLNFLAFIAISVLGLGLVTSSIPGLAWEGFLYRLLGVGPHELLASSDLGVFVALLLGILVPLVGGVPAIRRQERAALARQLTTSAG